MKNSTVSYHDELMKDLADPVEAAAYLDAALEDGDQEVFLLALRDLAEAKGMTALSRKTQLNRESLYRMLSEKGNPQLSSLTAILASAGLRLSVQIHKPQTA